MPFPRKFVDDNGGSIQNASHTYVTKAVYLMPHTQFDVLSLRMDELHDGRNGHQIEATVSHRTGDAVVTWEYQAHNGSVYQINRQIWDVLGDKAAITTSQDVPDKVVLLAQKRRRVCDCPRGMTVCQDSQRFRDLN